VVVGLIGLLIVCVCVGQPVPAAEAKSLPTTVAEPGNIDRVKAPIGDLEMFYLFQPPQQGRFGVADKSGKIVWQKNTGFRSMVDYFWGAEGKAVVLVTDCIQPEADLKALATSTRSWFFVLAADTGAIEAQGDLDTDVLDLPKQLPDAVGASHELKIELKDNVLTATIDHQGKTVTGKKALKDLPKKKN